MKNNRVVTQEHFDRLLAWLDPDRERAGRKYQEIRLKLLNIFTCRGCPIAEELADDTIDRVTSKVGQVADNYVGDPALYFYGVAKNVYKEYIKKKPPEPEFHPLPASSEEKEMFSTCLDQCLDRIDTDSRDFILHYYEGEHRSKIDHRKEMSERLGITLSTMRTRAHRVKSSLRECMDECIRGIEGASVL